MVPTGREQKWNKPAKIWLWTIYFTDTNWHALKDILVFPSQIISAVQKKNIYSDKMIAVVKIQLQLWAENVHVSNSHFKECYKCLKIILCLSLPNHRYSSKHVATESWLILVHAYPYIICLRVSDCAFLCQIAPVCFLQHSINERYIHTPILVLNLKLAKTLLYVRGK